METIACAIASESGHHRLHLNAELQRVDENGIGDFLGESPPMQALFAQIRKVAPTNASVLLVGESGTGKEMAAKALHDLGPRAMEPLIAVNCGSIPREPDRSGAVRVSSAAALPARRRPTPDISSARAEARCFWMRLRKCLPTCR